MNKQGSGAMLHQNFTSLGRVVRKLFGYYPRLAPLTVVLVLFSSAVSSIPSLFVQNVLAVIEKWYKTGDWAAARPEVVHYLTILGVLYILSLISLVCYTQIMAYMTQGFLDKLRREMFDGMQDLPISYFDTHKHGDIMSHYTNDIDTLRQLVSQALPTLIQSGAIVLVVFSIMLYFSIWLTLVLALGIVAMFFVTKVVGGGSAKYFMQQQKATGAMEGFAQEMMNGQKVIKVFNHEQASIRDFDKVNDELYEVSRRAHSFASILGPIMGNIGNILYVVLALVGGVFLLTGLKNVSLSGMPFSISILVPFLNMARQFTGNVNNLSQQFNAIVMAGAGAARVFSLIDEKPEADDGYVTLVNAKENESGELTETEERTGPLGLASPPHRRNAHDHAAARGCTDGECGLRLCGGQGCAPRRLGLCRARTEGCLCGGDRRGQDHDHQPHQPLLRHRGRKNPLRRHQREQDPQERPAPVPRPGASGHEPLHRDRPGEHPLRTARRDRRRMPRSRQAGRGGRLYHAPASGL